MKKLLLLVCLFAVGTQLIHAQKIDSATVTAQQRWYDYYWQKHKKKAAAGWMLLGTGLTMTGVGGALIANDLTDRRVGNEALEAVLFFGGLGATLTSIPLIISAGNSKRKAMLTLKGERVGFGNNFSPGSGYTALSIALPL